MNEFIHQFERGSGQTTVLSLHGTGGSESDLIPLALDLFPGASVLSPRGHILENGANRFFRRFGEGKFDLENLREETENLAQFVQSSSQKYAFDAQKVIALGYSNGANIAASLLLAHPETLAGAILLRAMTPFTPPKILSLEGKAVFLAAGRHDPIVPMENIDALARTLETARADVTLRFENAAHNLSGAEIEAARAFIKAKFEF
ncbi:phospholipase/carboxylesterase [Abditibacterium utsteinense]|uniref:Phospholipase/carboxylesterase n=1 Tax=Abditibacterium utsteinense TaxID=1960156 RepID=A0A2S8STD6_9BACT|nr:alpha/beta hydrolase [Abditibacterium utsteinense]PQV64009.1 phospholipase/carboxylesterase [Abditibacterium utsteinense]